VSRKADRIGPEIPKEFYATRFRGKGSKDPRLPRDEAAQQEFLKDMFSSSPGNLDEVVVVDWQ
jgi:hypothetical protein